MKVKIKKGVLIHIHRILFICRFNADKEWCLEALNFISKNITNKGCNLTLTDFMEEIPILYPKDKYLFDKWDNNKVEIKVCEMLFLKYMVDIGIDKIINCDIELAQKIIDYIHLIPDAFLNEGMLWIHWLLRIKEPLIIRYILTYVIFKMGR